MRLFCVSAILLCLINQSFAELTHKEINKICKRKDYNFLITELNKLADLSENKSEIRWYMPRNRETIEGYFEQVFEVINDVRDNGHISVHTYKISFIRKGAKILYYSIEGYKKNKLGEASYNQRLHSKKKFLKLRKHNKTYRIVYGHKLEINKLFNLDYTFGYKCGSNEIKTYLLDSVESLTENPLKSSFETLLAMLIDENVEIQMYGYYGFKKLQVSGYEIDFMQAKYIRLLENKKGSIAYCNITENKQMEISDVIAELNTLQF